MTTAASAGSGPCMSDAKIACNESAALARKGTHRMKPRGPGVACLAVLLIFVMSMPSVRVEADAIIDDFTGTGLPNPWPMTANQQIPRLVSFESDVPGVLGGERQSGIWWSGDSPNGSSVTASLLASQGLLDYHSTGGASGALQLVYGADAVFDFSDEAGLQLSFPDVTLADGAAMQVDVGVWDGSPNERGSAGLSLAISASGRQSLQFRFADFKGDSVDWTTIHLVVITIAGQEYQVSQVSAFTPAPGSLGALAVFAIGLHRRRR